jgi:putative transposase
VLDRDAYRKRLRAELKGSGVWLLDYCITSNHVHMLVTVRTVARLSRFMQKLQGEFAEWHNFRKKRSNQFWGGRYHATMIESGAHLWNCMTYIDLNMVRAGEVLHPREWKWGGYDELVGKRTRHTVLDMERVIELVGGVSRQQFALDYAAALEEAIDRGGLRRQPHWSEAIAVGGKDYVSGIAEKIRGRARVNIDEAADGMWAVHEPEVAYGTEPQEDVEAPYSRIRGTKIEHRRGFSALYWA